MLSRLLLLTATAAIVAGKPSTGRVKTHNKLLMISFDGFRWDYDQDVDTPNFDQLVRDGVKAKYISPPAITMTSPSHFTTVTGRTPPPWSPGPLVPWTTTALSALQLNRFIKGPPN